MGEPSGVEHNGDCMLKRTDRSTEAVGQLEKERSWTEQKEDCPPTRCVLRRERRSDNGR